MPIPYKSKLSSQQTNDTFLDKTIDDATVGRVDLNNDLAESGPHITNTQKIINEGKKVLHAASTHALDEQITPVSYSRDQVFRVSGASAPVSLNNILFSSQPLDGTIILVIGQSDANTVTIVDNNVQYGQRVNGPATLKAGYAITFFYDENLERFYEIARNF